MIWMFAAAAGAVAPPTVAVEWRGEAASLLVSPAEGHEIAADAPVDLTVRSGERSLSMAAMGGDLAAGKRQYLLRTIGRFEDLEQLEELILARRGDNVIRLSDVAEVRMDHFEKRMSTRFNGADGLMMAVRRESGSNVIEIKERMRLEEMAMPPVSTFVTISTAPPVLARTERRRFVSPRRWVPKRKSAPTTTPVERSWSTRI